MARRALTAALALAAACDGGPPERRLAESPSRDRLFGAPAALEVVTRVVPAAGLPIEHGLTAVFGRDLDSEGDLDFVLVAQTEGSPAPAPRIVAGPDGAALRLEPGTAAMWCLPARRATHGSVRVAARGGRLRVLELPRPPLPRLPRTISAAGLEGLLGPPIADHRAGPSDPGQVRFKTSVRARSLAVLLEAGDEPASAGPAEFRELGVFELPLARALRHPADGGPPRAPADPIEVTVDGETRPALLAVPPSEIRIRLDLPDGAFRLRFAYAVAPEARTGSGSDGVVFAARLERGGGSEEIALPRPLVRVRSEPADAGWHECRLDGVGEGEPATLVLTTRSASGRASEELALLSEPALVAIGPESLRPRNVVLISIDTLRRDRLGLYGHRRADGLEVSPALDRFARECVVFEEARALAPWTLPSHATLFTGWHPSVHGVERYLSALPRTAALRTLAESLGALGLETAAFTGGGFLDPAFGLQRGFDRWATIDPLLPPGDPIRQVHPRPGEPAVNQHLASRCDVPAIARFLDERRDEPFFLFVHSYVAHNYRPPADLAARLCTAPPARDFDPLADSDERTPGPEALADLAQRYEACVAAADRGVGGILDALRASGLLDRTIVVVTSDHGEELGDHGGFGHGRTLHDELLRVPLLVRAPGLEPRREPLPVTLADVAPTLESLCGIDGPSARFGRRLLPVADVDPAQPVVASLDEMKLGVQRALILNGRKLIEVERMSPVRPPLPVASLFDLGRDPGERADLALAAADPAAPGSGEARELLERMRKALEAMRGSLAEQRGRHDLDSLMPEPDRAMLDALGYGVGGVR